MQDAPPLRTGAELSVRHRGTGMDVPAPSYAPIRHLDRAGERVSGCPCRKTGNHHINREQVKKINAKTFLTNHRPPCMLTSWPGSQQNHSGSEKGSAAPTEPAAPGQQEHHVGRKFWSLESDPSSDFLLWVRPEPESHIFLFNHHFYF